MRELASASPRSRSAPNLESDFRRMHRIYWDARVRWANELARNDPELFRHLVPCDPVVTVAPDVVFFECFSKDESAYGCLTVDRDALRAGEAGLGTTNVDYSLALYEHFQTLRSYRPTRLLVDPTGFEVKVEGRDDYREEKIDLPPSWLRGFGQLQAAMTLPCPQGRAAGRGRLFDPRAPQAPPREDRPAQPPLPAHARQAADGVHRAVERSRAVVRRALPW